MKRMFARHIVVLLLLFASVGVLAQRGGGRGGSGGGGTDGVPPTLLTEYDNAKYGMKFPAPPEFSIFTPEQPGRFRQMFADRIIYLVDLVGVDAAVSVRYLPKATEADVNGFKNTVESNPPQAKLPEYKKISVALIKIGAAHDKDAVEYVYTAKNNDKLITTRQVVFLHNGNGFIFTCSAPGKDYASIDKKSFQRLFATIEFK
jgi:hypothetical protein